LTTSHPRVAIHTTVATKAKTSMAMQSQLDRCSGAGELVGLAGSTAPGRSMWKGAFMTRLPPEETSFSGRDRIAGGDLPPVSRISGAGRAAGSLLLKFIWVTSWRSVSRDLSFARGQDDHLRY
jgi:hypothetical protein